MNKTVKFLQWLIPFLFIVTFCLDCKKIENGPKPSKCDLLQADPIQDQYILYFYDYVHSDNEFYDEPVERSYIESVLANRIDKGHTIIDSCLCSKIFLMKPPPKVDMIVSKDEANGKTKPVGKGFASLNYPINFDTDFGSVANIQYDSFPNNELADDSILVAIVDSGFDPKDTRMEPLLWNNPNESNNSTDEDGNCIKDDVHGTTIHDNSSQFIITDNHGTAVAGKVYDFPPNQFPSNVYLKLMNVKFTNNNSANLFDAVCGMRYAIDQGASIINASFGLYRREVDSLLLEIAELAERKGVTIVAGAGNDTVDIDECPFYPASLAKDFENVISVAAVDTAKQQFADFSNYGDTTVLIAASGVDEEVLLWNNEVGTMDGTSIATPLVTHAIAILKARDPAISHTQLKSLLFRGAGNLSAKGYIPQDISTKVKHGVLDRTEAIK